MPPRTPLSVWVAMIGVVLAAVVFVEVFYARAPIPPGVDPGDWFSRSYGFIGQRVPPAIAFGSPYLYPPLVFPLLGALVIVMGGPLGAGFVAGGLLMFGYGVSLAILASRFFRFGPVQVGFVGATVFCGTTLSMFFWGAYPNILAFVFFNLFAVVLLGYLRSGESRAAFLGFVLLTLLYLTHSLTFSIAIALLAVAGVLVPLLCGGSFLWERVKNRGLIAGVVLLAAVVGVYNGLLRLYHIVGPNYFTANPAAVVLDNAGVMFAPLHFAPAFLPSGPAVYLSTTAALAVCASVAGAATLLLLLAGRWRPAWVDLRHVIAVAMLASSLLAPVVGTLIRVGTDYPRFLYFLPVPTALLVGLVLDRGISGPADPLPRRTPALLSPPPTAPRWPGRSAEVSGYLAVSVVLVLLIVNVSIPASAQSEFQDTGPAHSAQFLSAAEWLAQNPTSGNVLTLQGAARWVEAISHRGAYDVGPTWLDFEAWQIINSQESFWALNSRVAATDNVGVLSYSSPVSPVLSQSPMYSVYVEGVTVPVLRLLSGTLSVTETVGNSTVGFPSSGWGTPQLNVSPVNGTGTLTFTTPNFLATITGSLLGGGTAVVDLSIAPTNGSIVRGINLTLGSPPSGDALLHTSASQGLTQSVGGFSWSSSGTLGLLSDPTTVVTVGLFTPAPAVETVSDFPSNTSLSASFVSPGTGGAFSVSLRLATAGASNPGVSLPLVMDTESFLHANNIDFLLVPTTGAFAPTTSLYETVYGWQVVYANPQWEVLQG